MACVGWCFGLLLLLQVEVLLAYNVDVSPHQIFSVNGSRYFGYRVQQMRSTNGERILVGDPDLGILRSCDVNNGTCDIITLPNHNVGNNIGLTLEVEPESERCILCGSGVSHECDQMLYMNGFCYVMESCLTPTTPLSPGYQECQKAAVDLCFLFDGSGSTGEPELNSIKRFLRNAIINLRNTTINFAIVQFSGKYKTELDFKQYLTFHNHTDVIDGLTVLGGLTRTFQAIRYTLDHIFVEKAGHRPWAKKVLLIVTDGDAHDFNKHKDILKRANEMGVRRYLIGVGNNFNNEGSKEQIKELASQPNSLHTLLLGTFKELETIFVEVQQKILAIEGVQTCGAAPGVVCNDSAHGSSFSRELSSAGLSAVLTKERQLLGDPGIYDWSGGILDISGAEKLMNISLNEEDKYGYLGYSVAILRAQNETVYISGAPRYQYVGLVSVFRETPDQVERFQNILGEQVGSYFGSEIEVCDMDQDRFSDVVLIAAPHFYDLRWSGQVSVYRYTEVGLVFEGSLHGESGHLHSQFGAAVSCLGDLNGDGWFEVAVGAPYEGEGRGALYIFGGVAGGVHTQYTQRLEAPDGGSGFGLAVHGVLDMTADGLTDIAVGGAGSVALYRSRPLLSVNVSVTTTPTEIPIPNMGSTTCDISVTLKLCVHPKILTPLYTGSQEVSVRYVVSVEAGRPVTRMSLMRGLREVQEDVVLEMSRPTCWNHSLSLVDCLLEDASPVLVTFSVSQIPDVSPWLVSPSSNLTRSTQIPFQLCSHGVSCEPDFHLRLLTDPLVVKFGAPFSVTIQLHNKGENAQRVQLVTTFPRGLSFRMAHIAEASRRMSVSCQVTQSLVCNVSHPIMGRASWAHIHLMFDIMPDVSWPDRVLLTARVTSQNDGPQNDRKNRVTRELPVLQPINIIALRVENSTKYLQFIKETEQSNVTHIYKIANMEVGVGLTHFVVTLTLPAVAVGELLWHRVVTGWGDNCTQTDAPHTEQPGNKTFLCTMERNGTFHIEVTGALRPERAWTVKKSVNVSSAVKVTFNQTRYNSSLGRTFHHVQVTTQVDLVVLPNNMPYIVGGTFGGVGLLIVICVVLYLLGFFKRYKDRMQEEAPPTEAQQPMTSEVKTAGAKKGPQEPLTSPAKGADPTGDM